MCAGAVPVYLFVFGVIFMFRKPFHCPLRESLPFGLLLEAGILGSGLFAVPLALLRELLG
jgi:hypothetical protein